MEAAASKPTKQCNYSIDTGAPQYQPQCSVATVWASVFDTACWVSPMWLYAEVPADNDVDDGDEGIQNASHATDDEKNQQQQQQEQQKMNNSDLMTRQPDLGNNDATPADDDDDIIRKRNQEADEVLGWTLDAAARGVVAVGTAVFVSSELLKKATEAAACGDVDDFEQNGDDCDGRVHGFKPSSILTNIVMLVGIFSAIAMPLVGSLIDHTPYRRAVGATSATLMIIMIFIQMFVMRDFWFAAAILQVVIAICYTIHLCAVYAYLPELTSDGDQLMAYTSRFVAAQYGGSVIFLVAMVGILTVFNSDERFETIRISQSWVFGITTLFMGYSWVRLFRPRPASQKIAPGDTLVSAGFWKIFKTSRTILMHHNAIKWFLVAASLSEAATTAFSTIAITYMTEQLGFTARENGIAILLLMIFGIPGTKLASWLKTTINPITSLQICLVVWILTISSASVFLRSAEHTNLAYMYACIWGIAIGWVYPTEKALYVTIIPHGQEAELMGTYICACQIISWLPPLIFSVSNEAGYSMKFGLSTLTFFFFMSFMTLFLMGDYDEAVVRARLIDEGKCVFAETPTNETILASCYNEGPCFPFDYDNFEEHDASVTLDESGRSHPTSSDASSIRTDDNREAAIAGDSRAFHQKYQRNKPMV
mmetsp:Transcript_728/g.1752  ORF Transcript_728/g.1752 Transcript_728/m.1752 type:complete len:652 (-) Transcript_728:38-1993(-)